MKLKTTKMGYIKGIISFYVKSRDLKEDLVKIAEKHNLVATTFWIKDNKVFCWMELEKDKMKKDLL
jgi:hypothetical protein